jgi:hypothetical protein
VGSASTTAAGRPASAAVVAVAPQALYLEPQLLDFKPKDVFVVFFARRVPVTPFVEVSFQRLEAIAKIFQRFRHLAHERLAAAVVAAGVRLAQILNRLLHFL